MSGLSWRQRWAAALREVTIEEVDAYMLAHGVDLDTADPGGAHKVLLWLVRQDGQVEVAEWCAICRWM